MAASTANLPGNTSYGGPKPVQSTQNRPTVVPQMLQELNQRTDWTIQLVTQIGLALAGVSPYPATGIPLVFAGNITTLSTSTATFGGPAVFSGSFIVGTTVAPKSVLVNGLIAATGTGAALPAAAAVVGTTLTIPTTAFGTTLPALNFSVPDAGVATTISTIASPAGITLAAGCQIVISFGAIATNNYTLNNAGNMRVNGGSISIAVATAPLVPAGSTSVLCSFLFDGTKWKMTAISGVA